MGCYRSFENQGVLFVWMAVFKTSAAACPESRKRAWTLWADNR